jgi:hypothetical protein
MRVHVADRGADIFEFLHVYREMYGDEAAIVPKCLGNAWDRGKGRRAVCMVSICGVPEGSKAQRR